MTINYLASILRVIDGDTVDALVELGFGVCFHKSIRLAGINTPEANTPEGIAARDYLASKVLNRTVTLGVETRRVTEKYGRILGTLIIDGTNVNAEMIQYGLAVPYDGTIPRQKASAIKTG